MFFDHKTQWWMGWLHHITDEERERCCKLEESGVLVSTWHVSEEEKVTLKPLFDLQALVNVDVDLNVVIRRKKFERLKQNA